MQRLGRCALTSHTPLLTLGAPSPLSGDEKLPTDVKISNGKPMPWKMNAQWPTDTVPTLKVGQILVKPTENLPEMYNALSMAIAYPPVANAPASLIDPTCVRHGGRLPIERSFLTEYGFTVGPTGNCQLRKGRYCFTGLPPSVSDRFYIDTNAAETNRMCLVGKWVDKPSGGSYLQLNVLTAEERKAIKDLVPTTHKGYGNWTNAVAAIPNACQHPYEEGEVEGKFGSEQEETEDFWLPKDDQKEFGKYMKAIKDTPRNETPPYTN